MDRWDEDPDGLGGWSHVSIRFRCRTLTQGGSGDGLGGGLVEGVEADL